MKIIPKPIELKPDLAEAYNNRGTAYKKKGDNDRAIKDYNKAIELKPESCRTLYINRGEAYADKGEYDRAIADHNKGIALNSDLAVAYYNRGTTCLQLGEWESARSDLTTAKEKGADIINEFRNDYESVSDFESKHSIQLPPDIAAMLTPQ